MLSGYVIAQLLEQNLDRTVVCIIDILRSVVQIHIAGFFLPYHSLVSIFDND